MDNNGVNFFLNDTDCAHCTALCEIEMFDLCVHYNIRARSCASYVITIEHNELRGMNKVYKMHDIRE